MDFKLIKSHGETYHLKVGEVTRYVTDIDHFYWIGTDFVPAVTSILDEAGPIGYGLREFWKNNTREEGEEKFKVAGEFGIKMHEAFEKLLKGEELDLLADYKDRREKKTLAAFADWFKTYTPTNFESEQVVASKKYKYAGTLDFVGKINGRIWLIDFKTTNGIYFPHKLQVLAYKQAYQESYGIKIDKCAVLRLGTVHKGIKNSIETGLGWECRVVEKYLTISNFMNVYRSYLALHNGKIPEPKEIIDYPDKLKLIEKIEKGGKHGTRNKRAKRKETINVSKINRQEQSSLTI